MRKTILIIAGLINLSIAAAQAPAGNGASDKILKKDELTTIINALADSIARFYIDEGIALTIQGELKSNLKKGAYDNSTDLRSLASQLSSELIALSNDKHFGVDVVEPNTMNSRRRMPGTYHHLAPYNYYFNKMEILPGNIGLLEIDQFVPTDYTGQLVVAAMNFFSNSDALIIDLRKCIGGDPRTIAQLAGFFFQEPVVLNISRNRSANTNVAFWTTKTTFNAVERGRIAFTGDTLRQVSVDYSKLVTIPIYVLTSDATFSAAEGIAFGLQTRKRAETVGATTGHGGNGIRPFSLPNGLRAFIPFVEIISPITGQGYQHTGVLPDIASAPAKALDVAYVAALQELQRSVNDEAARKRLDWAMRIHKLRQEGGVPSDLSAYAGVFGMREVTLLEGDLYYQREGSTQSHLEPLDKSHFLLDSQTIVRFSDDFQSLTIEQLSGTVNTYSRTNGGRD